MENDVALRLAQIREHPALSDIAAHFQREADECRATAAQIQKRIDGHYGFDGDGATKAHYDRNAVYFQARADVITEAVAALARAEQTIRAQQTVWIVLNGQGQIVGAYSTKEHAHQNSQYVVGAVVDHATGAPHDD